MPSVPEQIGSLFVTFLISAVVLFILFKTIILTHGCNAPTQGWNMCLFMCVILGVVLVVIGQMVYFWRGDESDNSGTRNFLSILIMVAVGGFVGFFTILMACTSGDCRTTNKHMVALIWTLCFCMIVGILIALSNYISKDID